MNRTPLRRLHATATLATSLGTLLALAEPALAHVDVRPRLVEQGKVTTLRIELPQLRAGAPPVRLEVEADGLEVLATGLRGVVGAETLWTVRARTRPAAIPGERLLLLRAFFADGESVEVDGSIVVVPQAEAAAAGTFPWLAVAAGVTLALAGAFAVLVRARRRR